MIAPTHEILLSVRGSILEAALLKKLLVQVWDCSADGRHFQQAASFHDHTDSVMCVSWDAEGELIATGQLAVVPADNTDPTPRPAEGPVSC